MEFNKVKLEEREVTVPQFTQPFADVCRRLESLSRRLLDLLPDPSIGPEERLERVARIVPASVLSSAHMRTARTKWTYLQKRLDELVPGDLTTEDKLEILVDRIHLAAPGDKSLFEKLEALGDHRISDIGR